MLIDASLEVPFTEVMDTKKDNDLFLSSPLLML
ncbi:hypothetical protein SAMN05444395_102374 [Flavobacterium fryxellicola]|nr:hypothetical protein SAMN05444395_102374 [Flavobacterium fryxellicola]